MKKAGALFPLGATVSRRTGEVRVDWREDAQGQIRFGTVMNRIGEEALRAEDAERREKHQARNQQAEA